MHFFSFCFKDENIQVSFIKFALLIAHLIVIIFKKKTMFLSLLKKTNVCTFKLNFVFKKD